MLVDAECTSPINSEQSAVTPALSVPVADQYWKLCVVLTPVASNTTIAPPVILVRLVLPLPVPPVTVMVYVFPSETTPFPGSNTATTFLFSFTPL